MALKTPAEPVIEQTAAALWENMKPTQLRQILKAKDAEELEPAITDIVSEIAQEAQEDTERLKIVFDFDYDAKLDPANPAFDIEAWRAAISTAGGYDAVKEKVYDLFKDHFAPIADLAQKTLYDAAAHPIAEAARRAMSSIAAFLASDAYKAAKAALQTIADFREEYGERLAAWANAGAEIQQLGPYLIAEFEAVKDNPEFAGCSIDDFFNGIDIDGNTTDSRFKAIIERARQRQAEAEEIAELEQAAADLPRIISNPPESLNYPLDKVNSEIWSLLTDAPANGQISLNLNTGKKDIAENAIILYGIDFDSVTTTKRLMEFDKRCYVAAATLFNAGNEIITATQVYYMMGNATPPNANDLRKVNDSLSKMLSATLTLDNQQEAQAYKGGYAHFKYEASLLPHERISAYINGQLTESAIHLFREPPLMSFARQRGQITTISRQLLESPVSKTEANLRIEDYLLERIAHMKRGNAKHKMLYSTIYSKCNITTAKQKQRAPEKIKRYLDHYKKCGWIKGYKEDADGITIDPVKED